MNLSEALTRIRLIDPQLRQADWRLDDKTQVRREIPVDGYDAEPWNGVTDYCLYNPRGQVLAVVEAKRCSRNPREAHEQLRDHATEIATLFLSLKRGVGRRNSRPPIFDLRHL